jgi:hypothetical protein
MAGATMVAEIDARIVVLEQELHELRTRRNAFAPLCTIPSELIVHIVRLIQITPEHHYTNTTKPYLYPDIKYNGKWTRMMMTCQHLRHVIVEAPALWRLVDCHPGSEWMQLCMKRRGSVPLDLIANTHVYQPDHKAVSDFARKRFSQCRAAYYSLHSKDPGEVFSHIIEQPAPLMEHLQLSARSGLDSALTLTPMLLGGACSNLRTLTLKSLSEVKPDPPHFPALQRLELDVTWIKHVQHMSALFTLLERAPSLRELSLLRELDLDHEKVLDFTGRTIYLPHLHTLRIADHIEHIHTYLDFLPEPALNFHVFVYEWTDEGIWSPPGSDPFISLFGRLSSFWLAKTGEDHFPGGSVTADRPITNYPVEMLRFSSAAESSHELIFECKCKITGHHPLVDQIRTLHVKGDRTGPALGAADGTGSAFMTALELVMIDGPGTAKQLQTMEKFIKEYCRAHPPIQVVEVHRPGHKLVQTRKVDDFFRRIQKAGVVTTALDGTEEDSEPESSSDSKSE